MPWIKKDEIKFVSPVNLEGSWGERKLADEAETHMELYLSDVDAGRGLIEWEIPSLEIVESIGLWFGRDEDGNLALTDYDGVMSFPMQAVPMLERNGINCDYVKEEDDYDADQ